MKKLNCPLCIEGKLQYKYKNVHYWVCEDCPFIGFEYYKREDVENLINIL